MIDANGDNITDTDIMAHTLANLGNEETVAKLWPEDKYFIRRGSMFTNKYARINQELGERTNRGPGNPNYLLGTFPWLFPYGFGGFELWMHHFLSCWPPPSSATEPYTNDKVELYWVIIEGLTPRLHRNQWAFCSSFRAVHTWSIQFMQCWWIVNKLGVKADLGNIRPRRKREKQGQLPRLNTMKSTCFTH